MSMYPNNVGLFLIDGVADAIDWRDGNVISAVRDADAIMHTFAQLCANAGKKGALPKTCSKEGSHGEK